MINENCQRHNTIRGSSPHGKYCMWNNCEKSLSEILVKFLWSLDATGVRTSADDRQFIAECEQLVA